MAKNPLIRKYGKKVNGPLLKKSAGILEDYDVKKVVATKEGSITRTPTDDIDIVNKLYVDGEITGKAWLQAINQTGLTGNKAGSFNLTTSGNINVGDAVTSPGRINLKLGNTDARGLVLEQTTNDLSAALGNPIIVTKTITGETEEEESGVISGIKNVINYERDAVGDETLSFITGFENVITSDTDSNVIIRNERLSGIKLEVNKLGTDLAIESGHQTFGMDIDITDTQVYNGDDIYQATITGIDLNLNVQSVGTGDLRKAVTGIKVALTSPSSEVANYGIRLINLGANAWAFYSDFSSDSFTGGAWFFTGASKVDFVGGNLTLQGDVTGSGGIELLSDTFWTGAGTGLPFAEIFVKDSVATISVDSDNADVIVTQFTTNGLINNCTADAANNKITFTKKGIYKVSLTAAVSLNAGASVDIILSAYLNGVEQPQLHADRTVSTADKGSISFVGFIDVTTVGWDLDIRANIDSSTARTLTVEDINLNVMQIGGT